MVGAVNLGLLAEDDLDIIEAPFCELAARHCGSGVAVTPLGVGEIDEAIAGEAGIEFDIEQATLALPEHLGHALKRL